MITDGVVQLVDSSVDIENVLFDSGALQASYISKRWVDENRDQLGKRLRPCRGRVRMADNQTVVDVHERFRSMAAFTMSTGQVVCGIVDFWVLDMAGADAVGAIIGLPDILKSFLRVFVEMLEQA